MNKEQEDRIIKGLRKEIKNDYDTMKKSVVPKLQCAHLERIIINYTKIYHIKKPSIADKGAFIMLKAQYKALCVISKTKPIKFDTVD